jgi:hypothetical protein
LEFRGILYVKIKLPISIYFDRYRVCCNDSKGFKSLKYSNARESLNHNIFIESETYNLEQGFKIEIDGRSEDNIKMKVKKN